MTWLQATGIGKKIQGNWILHPLDLSVTPGQRLGIAGASGSGKTTLLKILGGHVMTDAGIVQFEGNRVSAPPELLLPGHPGIAYLSQQYELRNNYYVHEVLSYANDLPVEEAAQLYELCDIQHLLHRKTNDNLSGGERQRIALARLMTTRPRLLLLDEPFSNLDFHHKSAMQQIIANLENELGLTCILVSHDASDLLSWASDIVMMQSGSIVQYDIPKNVYNHPANTYVASLFGRFNLLPSSICQQLLPAANIPADKQLFVRPEQVKLTLRGDGMTGTVQELTFMGNHSLAKIQLQHVIISAVVEATSEVQPGTEVSVELKPSSNHWHWLP